MISPAALTVLEHLEQYRRLGWRIIPMRPGTKRPACRRWEQYQTQRPDEAKLRRWFADGRKGPAVILGSASGGLVCRDFDQADAYDRWATQHPVEADHLPTVRTARGFHVYCRSECLGYVELGSVGELRGDRGHLCILPPAVHKTGAVYKWARPLPADVADIPVLDPFSAGLAPENLRALYRRTTERPQIDDRQTTESLLKVVERGELSLAALADISAAIDKTQPADVGQRNRCIFELARRLRGIEGLENADPRSLIPFLQEWHRKAANVITTLEFSASLADFLRGWQKVKFPIHADYIRDVYRRALAEPDPGLEELDETNRLGILAGMCRILQAETDGETFYLACRTAAAPFGVSHTLAADWLFLLEQLGYIRTLVKGGTADTARKATRFRYLVPADTGDQ